MNFNSDQIVAMLAGTSFAAGPKCLRHPSRPLGLLARTKRPNRFCVADYAMQALPQEGGGRRKRSLLDGLEIFDQLLINFSFSQAHPRDTQELIHLCGF